MKKFIFLIFMLSFTSIFAKDYPQGFVDLSSISPSIVVDMRYARSFNFVGEPIDGYRVNKCILTYRAAKALAKVQAYLLEKKLTLKVYDCYRPKRAVSEFVRWSQVSSQKMKLLFYPRVSKKKLFQQGYIAEYSGHSRGSTVDLTISPISFQQHAGKRACYHSKRATDGSLDMGTNFDCLDKLSHSYSRHVSTNAQKNRQLLRRLMIQYGFKPYSKEWWHFTLKDEPYPHTYFDFPIR